MAVELQFGGGIMPPGETVILADLSTQPSMNGKFATIVSYDANSEQYTIKLEGTNQKAKVKGHNIARASKTDNMGASTIVEAVRRGDMKVVNTLIIRGHESGDAKKLFKAGLIDAVFHHFPDPKGSLVELNPDSNPGRAGALLNVLVNFLSEADDPATLPFRRQVAEKLTASPLTNAITKEHVLWGSPWVHLMAKPVYVALVGNLLTTPELTKKVLFRTLNASFFAQAFVRGGSWPPRFPAEVGLRQSCAVILTEFVDVLPPGEPSEATAAVAQRALEAVLRAPVDGTGGSREKSTFGKEFLPTLIKPGVGLGLMQSCTYIFGNLAHLCEASDGDGPGGMGPCNGVAAATALMEFRALAKDGSEDTAAWACYGSSILLSCLRGYNANSTDKRCAAFIESGALDALLRGLALHHGRRGRRSAGGSSAHAEAGDLSGNVLDVVGMLTPFAGLKHTRAAAQARGAALETAFAAANALKLQSSPLGPALEQLCMRLMSKSEEPRVAFTATGNQGKAAIGCVRCGLVCVDSKRCSKCSTTYCSRECQVDDWKNGAHKKICKMKQGLTRPKDFGRKGKDLSALGNQVIADRMEAVALIATLRGLRLLDCVVVVNLSTGSAPRALPVPHASYPRDYLYKGHSSDGTAEHDELEKKDRVHTLAILERNRLAGNLTGSVHGVSNRIIKTLPGRDWDAFQGAPQGKIAGMAEKIKGMVQGDTKMIEKVAKALEARGLICGEEIVELLYPAAAGR